MWHAVCVVGGQGTVNMRALPALVVLSWMSVSSSAFALEQSSHREISRDACAAAGLPTNFCDRVGTEAYNVDAYEWGDLAAHAQVDVALGQTPCAAANLVAQRVYGLGHELHAGLVARARREAGADGEHLATALGRALHTVQDNCTHRGVSNPQHAWYSLSDACSDTRLSPDFDEDALTCARAQTVEVMATFVAALESAGLSPNILDDGVDIGITRFPARTDVCDYLKSGNSWNGVDAHWENGVVVPAVLDQFEAGMVGGDAPVDVCQGDPDALADTTTSVASIDTSGGQILCFKVALYCLGKADGAVDEAPPWAVDEGPAVLERGASRSDGCAVAAGARTTSGPSVSLALAFGLATLLSARRSGSARKK